jgi:flagellar hook-basal body complex protein FliE
MKKLLVLITSIAFTLHLNAQLKADQWISTFDDVRYEEDQSFKNGKDANGSFHNGRAVFYNSYDAQWGSWTGFSMSKVNDTQTRGYENQYAAITGTGFQSTSQYAVAYQKASVKLDEAQKVTGFRFTNSTYAYWDMKEGSDFTKKFGGEDGSDDDSLLLIVEAYLAGSKLGMKKGVLADYRFGNESDDYILDSWEWMDLSSFGMIDSVVLSFESSDNGQFGINTPTYVCIDDLNGLVPAHETNIGSSLFNGLLGSESFDNNMDMTGGVKVGPAFYYNHYNPEWKSWSGWALSQVNNPDGKGFSNQYASAVEFSTEYMVGYGNTEIRMADVSSTLNTRESQIILAITNSAYTYWSMKEGDQFAKKFGGASGNDPDYLKLKITAVNHNGEEVTSEVIYLADYRSSDNSKDFILDEWKQIRLDGNTNISRILFSFESTDVGQNGINTPQYFCMAVLNSRYAISVNELSKNITVYPNPTTQSIRVDGLNGSHAVIRNMQGEIVKEQVLNASAWDVSDLSDGVYLLQVELEGQQYTTKLVKH